jgi:hypothetical protein
VARSFTIRNTPSLPDIAGTTFSATRGGTTTASAATNQISSFTDTATGVGD